MRKKRNAIANPNVKVLFDGLMVFMKGRPNDANNKDYQARLHTQTHGHEVRIAVYKNSSRTPEVEHVFQHEEIRDRFEHLWFYTARNGQITPPNASVHDSCKNILNLKTLVGQNARPRLHVLTPVVHFRNGELSAMESRGVNCTCFNFNLMPNFTEMVRHINTENELDKAYHHFKKELKNHPPAKLDPLPLHVQLQFRLGQNERLRLDSGNANEPNGRVLFELAPNSQDYYQVEFLNLPPDQVLNKPAHPHSHAPLPHPPHLPARHPEVVAEHLLHYFDAFDNTGDSQVLVEEHSPFATGTVLAGNITKRAGGYPDPPCAGGGYDFP